MPHHAPGEAGPRPHRPSASRSRAARAALLYLGRRNCPRVWVSPWGQRAVFNGLPWVTQCHLCHPVGALGGCGLHITLSVRGEEGLNACDGPSRTTCVARGPSRRHFDKGSMAPQDERGLVDFDGAGTPPSRLRRSTSPVALREKGEDLKGWSTPHRIAAPALDPADREGRAHRRDAGEAGEAIAVDAVVLFKIVRGDAQQVIGRAAHQVAIEDIGHVLHRGLEPVHRLAALAGQRDLDEGLQLEPQFVRIDLRRIAGDDPRRLKRLDPAVAGRGGDPGEIGQIGDRARRVFLERFEDQHVVAVHGKSFRRLRQLREISPGGRLVKANFGETFMSDRRIFGRPNAGEP